MQIETRIRPPQLNGSGPTEERDELRTGYVYGGPCLRAGVRSHRDPEAGQRRSSMQPTLPLVARNHPTTR
jgi:hypothetical protein